MNRIIRVIFFILVFATTTCRNSSSDVPDNNQAEIKFKDTNFDYGRIEQGSPGVCSFEFTNPSDIPLVINHVKTSCGCAIPEWPKDPLNPGKKGIIKVKYNTQIRGKFRKTITIYANAKNSPVNLFISGEVIPENQTE